jgi:hypothetical protein
MQTAVLVNFIILILLWFFRDPQFIPGRVSTEFNCLVIMRFRIYNGILDY